MASRKSKESRKKLVVVGDGFCGKTCLLLTYCSGEFPSVYVPTIFETYATTIQVIRNTLGLMTLPVTNQVLRYVELFG